MNSEMKNIMTEYRDKFIEEEINKHLMFFREIGVIWSFSINETIHNEYNFMTPEYSYEMTLKFMSKNNDKFKFITIYDYNVLDNSTNIFALLRDTAFNWDYTKFDNYFNGKLLNV